MGGHVAALGGKAVALLVRTAPSGPTSSDPNGWSPPSRARLSDVERPAQERLVVELGRRRGF